MHMLGKNHIIANLASVAILGTADIALVQQSSKIPMLTPAAAKIANYMSADGTMALPLTGLKLSILLTDTPGNICMFWIMSFLLFIIGSLLPDIDSPNSLLGRHISINVPHRTWTHAIWGFLVLCVLSVGFRPLAWCALGMFLHLFWDSLSVGGNCWFYPFSKYKDYSSGAHVKRHHWAKLYRVGSISERVIVCVLAVIAMLCIGRPLYQVVIAGMIAVYISR
jgi:inner membrane protein